MTAISRQRAKTVLITLLWVIGVPSALYVSAAAYFALVPSAEDTAHRRSFDATLWRAPRTDDDPQWPVRLRMVDDLIQSKRLDGLTRREVDSLLGPRDDTDTWRDWDLVYRLGPQRRGMFRIDSEWLVVRFDTQSRVAAYRLVGD